MNKKFMRGIAAVLAAVMMMPTAAFANTPGSEGSDQQQTETPQYVTPTSKFKINKVTEKIFDGGDSSKLQLTLNENVDPSKVEWLVVEPGSKYVSVDQNGLVTSKGLLGNTAEPTFVIRATYDDKSTKAVSVFSDKITLYKRALKTDSMTVTSTLDIQQSYTVGESFNRNGIEVRVKYTDKADDILLKSTEYKVIPETLAADTKEVTISYEYNGDTATAVMPVKVVEPEVDTVESIEIINPNKDKLTVKKGDSLDELILAVEWKLAGTKNVTLTKGGTLPSGMEILGYTLGYRIEEDTPLKVIYNGKEDTLQLEIATVDSVTIADPYEDELVVEKNATLDRLTVLVKWTDGTSESITVSKNQSLSSDMTINGYTLGQAITKDTLISVTYKGKTSETIAVKLGEAKKLLGITLNTVPTKTKYREGQELDLTGLKLDTVYSDGSTPTITYSKLTNGSKFTVSRTKFTEAGTYDIAVTYKEGDYIGIVSFTVTVEHIVDVTGLSTSSSGYKMVSDVKLAIGDDLEWTDLFEEVTIKYNENGKAMTKVITSPAELEAFLSGAKLHLEVEGKQGKTDADVVEASDLKSNGKVDLLLWLEYNEQTMTSSSKSYDFEMEVEESECMVQVCSSSSTVKGTAVFTTFKAALEAIEDEDDFDNIFDCDLDNYDVYITLGVDQKFTGSFKPDYDNDITIDLNGNELKLNSDWVEYYNSNNLLEIDVINSDDSDDAGKLTYLDKDITLDVEHGGRFTFAEGKIPGIYAVTVKSGITNGKVEANKTTVNHGGDVKFTITPNSGYEISDVKVNSKSVTKDSEYDVNSKGVATYTLKKADKDIEITATFKKAAAAEKEEEKKPASTTTWTNPFTDVTTRDTYYESVAYVCSEGLMNGVAKDANTPVTEFKPRDTMTRAQFVTTLGRLAGIDVKRYSGTKFTDVSTTDNAKAAWAAPYIQWAVENNITKGIGDNKFGPNDPVTHTQMYLFMYRFAMLNGISVNLTGVNLSQISDANEIPTWAGAEDGIKFAVRKDILVQRTGNKITPNENALRCELAMLLHGFCTRVLER